MEPKIKNRKNYKKPQINQVNLIIEEAVLQACKLSAGDTRGKNTKGCNTASCQLTQGS